MTETAPITYLAAVNEALRWGLATFDEALLYGEDVGLPGGAYGASKRLHDEFGDRVFDTPISESAILGSAVGAAMSGFRPVVEIMFADFFLVALDQVVNQAANVRYVSRGAYTCPLTIRSQQAAAPGACAQHAQSLEAFFAHVPGLRVGLPATPADAYQMLRAAIACEDPCIVLESRTLYPVKGPVDLEGPLEPVGGARVVRAGDDLTVVTWSRIVADVLAAADELAERGVSVEVIDLRWLNPLDFGAVAESIAKTHRGLVVHEAHVTGGFGAEIAARIAGESFWDLEAPVSRLGAVDAPMPVSQPLQQALLPSRESILRAVERMLAH